VLSSQGHIQALVNPSGNPKGEYRTNEAAIGQAMTPDEWEVGAASHAGSWWDHWTDWLKERAGTRVNARSELGSDDHPVLVEAPGTYVVA
jgi:polyhydroxyalkanoate synthase